MTRFSARLRAGVAGAVLMAAAVALAPPAQAADAGAGRPSLWGTVAIEKDSLKPFPKWTDFAATTSSSCSGCQLRRWQL